MYVLGFPRDPMEYTADITIFIEKEKVRVSEESGMIKCLREG